MTATGTLLGVWAHPDDEPYRVVVITATAGEVGTEDPERWPPRRLARRRRRELRNALDALDVTEHHDVGYPDGGCHDIDGTARIAEFIDRVRPGDNIITEVEVLASRDDKPIHELRTAISNQHGTVVLDGTATVYQASLR